MEEELTLEQFKASLIGKERELKYSHGGLQLIVKDIDYNKLFDINISGSEQRFYQMRDKYFRDYCNIYLSWKTSSLLCLVYAPYLPRDKFGIQEIIDISNNLGIVITDFSAVRQMIRDRCDAIEKQLIIVNEYEKYYAI